MRAKAAAIVAMRVRFVVSVTGPTVLLPCGMSPVVLATVVRVLPPPVVTTAVVAPVVAAVDSPAVVAGSPVVLSPDPEVAAVVGLPAGLHSAPKRG